MIILDKWWRASPIETKEHCFNYIRFGLRCPKHKTEMKPVSIECGGGGFDNFTGEKPVSGKNSIYDWVRRTFACTYKTCKNKVVVYCRRKELNEKLEEV